MITDELEQKIAELTGATDVQQLEVIQKLWSGYGSIIRYSLLGCQYNSVVVKHIDLRTAGSHPRGWNTDISHQRKVKSYQVEMEWYKTRQSHNRPESRFPECHGVYEGDDQSVIILEDLNASGFPLRKSFLAMDEMNFCLKWLASFHASCLEEKPFGLWNIGCYWHLDTRPDELNALDDEVLKSAAEAIENRLTNARFSTIVHGDAKLANFCFSKNGDRAAMVDFQYTGGGPGVKDLAYFIGSCLYEEECERLEAKFLDTYFSFLKEAIIFYKKDINPDELELEWRELYPFAWADFHRFLKGWNPGHWKINSYSERLTREVVTQLEAEGK